MSKQSKPSDNELQRGNAIDPDTGREIDPVCGKGVLYTCPMHPEVQQSKPGACPKCGMALEPMVMSAISSDQTEYVCPMHPEVVQDHPGSCPKCGMALEPRTVAVEEDNAELNDMSRRFWVSAILAIPVFISAMGAEFWPQTVNELIAPSTRQWLEMILATPVVIWGGGGFFVRGWQSVLTRNLNMFTLIGLGTGVTYIYTAIATLFPQHFPNSFRNPDGNVSV